jgi:hypothetical protein
MPNGITLGTFRTANDLIGKRMGRRVAPSTCQNVDRSAAEVIRCANGDARSRMQSASHEVVM